MTRLLSMIIFILAFAPCDARAHASDDLTGYWKNGSGHIVYFTYENSRLESHHTKDTPDYAHHADEIDFTATVRDNLVHGAHLIRLSWPLHRKCPSDMWVGIGLILNEEKTMLTGFRGHRTVDLVSCDISVEKTKPLAYTRMLDTDGQPLR